MICHTWITKKYTVDVFVMNVSYVPNSLNLNWINTAASKKRKTGMKDKKKTWKKFRGTDTGKQTKVCENISS